MDYSNSEVMSCCQSLMLVRLNCAADPLRLVRKQSRWNQRGSRNGRLTCKFIEVLDCACRQIRWVLPANNLLIHYSHLCSYRALLWRGRPPTPLVASSYWALPGLLRLSTDILSWLWQHEQCRSGGRTTLIQTKSQLWFSTLKCLHTTHTR